MADATVIIDADISNFKRKIQDASAAVEGFLRKQNESIREVSALSGAWLGMLKESLGGLMSSFAATGDQFDKMSQRTGISTGALSEYAHAAQMCGSDIQTVESALKNMASQLVQAQSGSARALTNFERLGIDVEQFAKLTPEEQFDTLAAAIAKIEDPTERAGAALKIFGSAGQQLLPLFTSGSKGLAAMREEARKLGVSVDESTAKLGAEYTDAMTRVKQSLAGVGMTLAASLAPQITEFANWLSSVVAKVRQWIGEHRELTRTIIAVGTGLTGVAATVWGFQKALSGVSSAVAQFSSLIGTNPVLAVLGAVAGAAVYGAMKFNDYCKAQNEALNGGGWSDVAKREFEAGERLREQDVQRFERLKQLSAQENLTTLEIQEAVKLAAELQARYGDVGIAVDAVAGKIRIADGAQAKMNERMAEARKRQLDAAIAEAKHNAKENVVKEKVFNEQVGTVKRTQANVAAAASNKLGSGPRVTGMDVLMNSEALGDSNEYRELVRIEQEKANAELAVLLEQKKAMDAMTQAAEKLDTAAVAPHERESAGAENQTQPAAAPHERESAGAENQTQPAAEPNRYAADPDGAAADSAYPDDAYPGAEDPDDAAAEYAQRIGSAGAHSSKPAAPSADMSRYFGAGSPIDSLTAAVVDLTAAVTESSRRDRSTQSKDGLFMDLGGAVQAAASEVAQNAARAIRESLASVKIQVAAPRTVKADFGPLAAETRTQTGVLRQILHSVRQSGAGRFA